MLDNPIHPDLNIEIEPEEVKQEEINHWFTIDAELAKLKSEEAILRNKIFKYFFRNPVEGTNKVPLDKGWVLKATLPINRKVQIELLTAMDLELRAAGIPMDDLVVRKPELSVTSYRKLTDEQVKLFDRILEIKPGSPQMEIVLPKRGQAPV